MAALSKVGLLTCLVMVIGMATPGFAQVGGAPGGGGPGGGGQQGGGGGFGQGGGGGRGFNPAAQLDQLKADLAVTDDEWAVLQPKIQAVLDAQRANPIPQFGRGARGGRGGGGAGGGRGRGGPGGGGPGGAGPAAVPSAVQVALTDLSTTLQDPGATADSIKNVLDALRQARQKASDDLVAAQTALKANLTQRQEAVLVVNGILD